ncbi:MAG: efflux RND transporter permease subunit [candidate division NC10 bacterium]|nr:efflux RND transporter permease subunit [candidate division NC10 bacterium]
MLKALPKFAVEHPMVMIPIYLAMIGIGIVLYFQTPLQLQPYVENPTVGIVISYPGVSAEDMEYYFARPIEKKMGVLGGVTFIRSNSQEGRTEIDIGFEYLSDMNQHKLDVQTLLTNMLNELPFDKDNTTNPWVVHVANDNVPILDLNVSHAEWDDVRLREFLDNIVRERFESVSGVQSIMPYGGKRRLMLVEVDRDRLAAYQLGLMDVKAAIEQQHVSRAAGKLRSQEADILVRADELLRDPRDLVNIPIGTFKDRVVYLRDVATVKDTFAEVTGAYHANGKRGILLTLIKQPQVSDREPINGVLQRMDELVREYPELKYEVVYNRLNFLERIIANAWHEMFLAFAITAIVVLAFLNQIRPTFIVLVTLPAAVSAGFIWWRPFGFTVDTSTLLALTFVIGRLVDDSVIMMEVIDRHLKMGKSAKQAAIEGAQEVSGAMVAIGVSSWLAMGPALFLGGSMGTGFKGMTAPMIFANLMSTFFTLTLDPTLRAYFLKPRTKETMTITDYLDRGIEVLMAPAQWLFKKAEWLQLNGLNWAINNRFLVIAIAASSIYAGYKIWPTLGWEGMPLQDTGQAVGELEAWPGTSFQDTEKIISRAEEYLLKNPEIKLISTQIGIEPPLGSAPNFTYFSGYGVRTVNKASFKMTFTDTDVRTCQFYHRWADTVAPLRLLFQPCAERSGRNIWTILDTTQAQILANVPGIRSLWFMEMGATPFNTARAPVEAIFKGDDLPLLDSIGKQALAVADRTPGLVQPFTSWSMTMPQYHLEIDRVRAKELGLAVPQIAMQAFYALNGGFTSEFFKPGEGYRHSRFMIRYKPEQRRTLEDLEQVKLATPSGKTIPLKAVARVVPKNGVDLVYKEDLQYALSVMGQYREVGLKMATAGLVMGSKTAITLPKRYTVQPKGMMLEMLDNIYRLYNGMYLAIGILFILLLLQTRSMVSTLAILVDAPLEWMGAIYLLWLRGFNWSPPVMWGMMLATVMVMATGILLVEKITQLEHAGLDRRRAVLTASPIRLRPVLMTTLTTAAAFIPPMIAPPTGMDRFRPITTAIVGALISSTALGLITVPTIYTILDDVRQFFRWVYAGTPFARKVSGEEFARKLPMLPTEVLWELRHVDQFKPGVFGFDTSVISRILEERERAKMAREEVIEVGEAPVPAIAGGDGHDNRVNTERTQPESHA